MKNLNRGRLLFSTCLTGAALALAPQAHAQERDPKWQPRADVDAQVSEDSTQVAMELFAPVAQNDANLLFLTGRIGEDQRYGRNGSVTVGARGRIDEDAAIGVHVGADFYQSTLTRRGQTAMSFGVEAFTSVFDVRLNYRLPVDGRSTVAFLDPDAAATGVISVEANRLIERKSGFRLEEVPLAGANGEIGARLMLSDSIGLRGSAGAFDYHDKAVRGSYRGVRGGLELDAEDPFGMGGRFRIGVTVQDDNRFGTEARGTARISIPFGRGAKSDRSGRSTGLERQMGDRLRRDYVVSTGTRYTDLSSTSFAVDARTGKEFGGVYYVSGAASAAGAGTAASPTTLGDAVTRAGQNGVVVALGSAGAIQTGGVTLAADQYLVGGASSVDVRLSNGSLSRYSFGGTNGIVTGTNAGAAAINLGQGSVVRDLTVRGAGGGIAASGVGGFALNRVTIENVGGAGLVLTGTTGAVVIDGITVRDAGGVGVAITGGSDVTLRNAMIGGGTGAISIRDGGAALTTTLTNLMLSSRGGNVVDIDGSGSGSVTVAGLSGITVAGGNGETGGFAARSVTFDSSPSSGLQAVSAGQMQLGTAEARIGGTGLSLSDVSGSLGFAGLGIANQGGTGLIVRNDKAAEFTLTTGTGSVDTVGGTALDLDPLSLNLTFATVSSTGASGAGVVLDTVRGVGTGGNALTIGTLNVSGSGAQGLLITGGSTGAVTIGGGAITGSGGAAVQVGAAGVAGSGGTIGLNYGGTISGTGAAPLVALYNVGGAIRFGGAIGGTGPIVLDGSAAGSSVIFAGATSITGGGSGAAVSLDNLGGSVAFTGALTIAGPVGTGIRIGTVPGGVTFGDVDITGLGSGTGVDLTQVQGNVTFGTLDITGTGAAGSTALDLTGATNSGAVVIQRPSTITGVDTGIDLTNVSMTGSLRFGDGSAANGQGSVISANTPLVVTGLDGSKGRIDLADVRLVGDTSNLTGGSFTSYYVKAGASGTGASGGDAGSLAGALASGAQYIVLLNDPTGGRDVLDAAAIGGSFTLGAGQTIVSFLHTDFFSVTGASLPANLIVSGIGESGITNPFAGSGAAVLTTTTAGAATIVLADGAKIDGLIIGNDALGVGVTGVGVTGATIVNSDISGGAGAIAISDGGAASTVNLANLNLSASGGTTLVLDGSGGGSLGVTGAGVNVAATGGAAALEMQGVTLGGLELGTVSADAGAGTAIRLDGLSGGTLSTGAITLGGRSGPDFAVEIANNAATLNLGAISLAASAARGLSIAGNSGTIRTGALDLRSTGATGLEIQQNGGRIEIAGGTIAANANALFVSGVGSGGTVTFGALSASTGAGGTAMLLGDIDGAVTFTGTVSLAGNGGLYLAPDIDGTVSFGAVDITGTGANGFGIVSGAGSSGSASFGDVKITGLGANGVGIRLGAGGTTRFGNVDITGLAAGSTGVDARGLTGAASFATLDIGGTSASNTRGIDLTGASFAGDFTVGGGSSITGVTTGVDLTNAAITGNFRYGDGSNTDANGAASTIDAITPIAIGGLSAATGSYDFSDARLIGDTSSLASDLSVFFVEQGATGAGTKTDPGSLAAAQAAGVQVIVLLNNLTGGQDLIDASALGGLTLSAGQRLLGFLNGDTLTIGGGSPTNVKLFGITAGELTNPYAGSGAPVLTSSVGNTVTLANNVLLDGLVIRGAAFGVAGSGVSNVSILRSDIRGSSGGIGLSSGGAAASVTLRDLQLGAGDGAVLRMTNVGGGSLSVVGSGIDIMAGGPATALDVRGITLSGDLSFGAISTGRAIGNAVWLSDIGGTGRISADSVQILGTSNGSGITLSRNSVAVDLGDVTVSDTQSNGIQLLNNSGDITLGSFAIRNAGGIGMFVTGQSGAMTAAGGSIDNAAGPGLVLGNIDGSVRIDGPLTIASAGDAGIELGAGSAGTIALGAVNIALDAANSIGVKAQAASGNISFGALNITSTVATGTTGIDLRGATLAGSFTTATGSSIAGVGTGVDLTNAAITGSFRFGDGSNTDANGAGSSISAATPLILTGLNGAAGTYNFADVNLVGDTSNLTVSAYFVMAGSAGSGTRSDPGSLAGAMAAGATYIVLLNDPSGGNDVIDATGAGGLVLAGGQYLYSFRDTDSFNVGGGAPANVLLHNVQTGLIENPFAGSGAPILTSSGGVSTVVLGGSNVLNGLILSQTGTGAAISGSGIAGLVTILNSTISGGAAGAINLQSGAAATIAALDNLRLSASGGNILNLNGVGAGSLTVSAFANLIGVHAGETGGFVLDSVRFDGDPLGAGGSQPLTPGPVTLGSTAQRITGTALSLTNVSGTLNLTDLNIANRDGTGLIVANAKTNNFVLGTTGGAIDTVNGTAIDLDPLAIDMRLGSVRASGGVNGILLDQVEGRFTVTGVVDIAGTSNAGIAIRNNNGQSSPLQANFQGKVTIDNSGIVAGYGLRLTDNDGALIRFTGGLDVQTGSGIGLYAIGGGVLGITGNDTRIETGSGHAMLMNGITIGAEGLNLANVTVNAGANGITLVDLNAVGGSLLSLGTVNLRGITDVGIMTTGSIPAMTIADLDITLSGPNATGLRLTGSDLASLLVGDFDLTNTGAAGNSIGVDLRDSRNGSVIRLGSAGNASTIAGVRTGVYLDNASNAQFVFGDGDEALGSGSSISAVNAIDASSAPTLGSYNFRDIAFSSSPGAGFGAGKIYFVDSDGAVGGGNGSGIDGLNPMTLTDALAQLQANDTIVLVNNGNAIGGAGLGGATVGLLAGTRLLGFGDGAGGGAGTGSAALSLAITAPPTIQLAGGSAISITDPTGRGAATLATGNGAVGVTLTGDNILLSGFILDGAAGALQGLQGSATHGIDIHRLTARNYNSAGFYLNDVSGVIRDVTFADNERDIIANGGPLTIANMVSQGNRSGSLTLLGAGIRTLESIEISDGLTGIILSGVSGTVNATGVRLNDLGSRGLHVLMGTGAINFDATSEIRTTGVGQGIYVDRHSVGALNYGGLIETAGGVHFTNADGQYNLTGTTTLSGAGGIAITNGSSGQFVFGTGTTLNYSGTGDAFGVLNSDANVTYSGSIAASSGYAVHVDNHDGGGIMFNTGTITANGIAAKGISIANSNGGGVYFNGGVTLNTQGNTALSLTNNVDGTVRFDSGGAGLKIVTASGTGIDMSGGGYLQIEGAGNSIATGSGTVMRIDHGVAGLTSLTLNLDSAGNTLGANGILISRSAGVMNGSVNIAGGAITASNRGVDLDGEALSFTYGGSITTSGASARSVEVTGKTVNRASFTGNITDTALGINLADNTGGAIEFTGPTIRLATVANATALTMRNNGGAAIRFTPLAGGDGLDVLASGTGGGISFTGGGTLTVTGTGNSVETQTGRILDMVDGNTGGVAIDILRSTGTVTGHAINLSNVDGGTLNANTVRVAGTTGADASGVFYGGGSTMIAQLGNVNVSNAVNGIWVDGPGNGVFTTGYLTLDASANGLLIRNSDNVVSSVNGGGISAGAGGKALSVIGGTGDISIASSLNKLTNGRVVSIDGHSIGTIDLKAYVNVQSAADSGIDIRNVTSGSILFRDDVVLRTGAFTAVNLLNNGATINFNNPLAITTTSGTGFNANNGGRVSIIGGLTISTAGGMGFSAGNGGNVMVTGAANTIQSGSGTALSVIDTAIMGLGLTFRSISSNGAVNGIVLNNTGSLGGLTVTGVTGGSGFSGGVILNSTGDGISLTRTENVRLSNMNIMGNLGNGIFGNTVNGFLIDNMQVTLNGNDAGSDESGINITNLTGTGATGSRPTGILDSAILNNNEFELQIRNSTGTLANFQLVRTTLQSNGQPINGNASGVHGNLFNFTGTGSSAMGLSVENSRFIGNWTAGTGYGAFLDTSGASMTVIVKDSMFTNNNGGINLSTGPGSSQLTYRLEGNTFVGQRSHAINEFHSANGPFNRSVNGTILGNTIGLLLNAGSGSQLGNGISIANEGAISAAYRIESNQIYQTQLTGISVNIGVGGVDTAGGITNISIANNIFNSIQGRGIAIQDNQLSGPAPTIRANIGGNSFTTVGAAQGNQYIRLKLTNGIMDLVQSAATAGTSTLELDDQNNFNDPAKINIALGSGTLRYAQPNQATPTAPVLP